MSKFCCIADLIRFMMKEAENLMKGSVHEDYLFIVHDYLVLMTAKDTIEWMKEKNYFHSWLLTMNGLQDGTPYVYEHALVALPGKLTPSVKDHRKARNPYYSRYGERWVEKL